MKIHNRQFGEIEYEPNSVVKFEEGILGFEELKEFILISEKDGYFFWLTAINEPEIIFPLFSINMLQDEYEVIDSMEPYGIVKLDKNPENMSINLKAPIFINHTEQKGFQKIIDNEEYPVAYPLFVKK